MGYGKIYIVAPDLGGPVAYSFAAAHPENVKKMVILDTLLPDFGVEEAAKFLPNGIWHLSFHAVEIYQRNLSMDKRTHILIGFMIITLTINLL